MELTQIGKTGRAHGIRGQIKLHIEEPYLDDLLIAKALLIGAPPIPYFVESIRDGGATIAKFETLDTREQVTLLSNRPVFLPAAAVTPAPATAPKSFEIHIGKTIRAAGYPEFGPIERIMDLPSHHLAEITHEGKEVLIPMHEDLIVGYDAKTVVMTLPEGLLDL